MMTRTMVVEQQAPVLESGVGFQSWHNMFGRNADWVPAAKEFTPLFTLAVHALGRAGH